MRSPLVMLAVAALLFSGCKKSEPEVVPTPTTQPQPTPAPPPPPPPPPAGPDPAACEAAIASGMNELSRMVTFETDQYDIRPADLPILDSKAEVLTAFPQVRLRITGHADERYTDEYNLVLGTRRAEAARDYLIRKGVNGSRLETASLGETAPLDPGHTEEAWNRNRRAEFTILAGRETLASRIQGCQ
ncbi:MAG TPA: OmpA family protein [Gemmatimonadales bacterium]